MKIICLSIIIWHVLAITAIGQQQGMVSPGIFKPSATEDSIRKTALDYAEGYYSGDGIRMSRAIHQDLNKAYPRYIQKTGEVALSYSTYSSLVEASTAKVGFLADTARHLSVTILHMEPTVAMVRVNSAQFNDYLQEIMINGEWKIINVLWNGPQNIGWLKDFNPEKEKKEIEIVANRYLRGQQRGNAGMLGEAVSPDFSRATIIPIGRDGRSAVQRSGWEGLMENARAGIGRQDEALRDNTIEILDVMDGLAMVRLQTATNLEFLQMYKDPQGWSVFNSFSTPRTDLNLNDLLPAIAGEPMPSFSLPVYQGGNFSLSDHQGHNILLMFPRGRVGNGWCLFCQYQYLDLVDLEKQEQLQKKYDLEIVFVLPYGKDDIEKWFTAFPASMKTLDGIRNPAGGQAAGLQKEFGNWARIHYPKTFDLSAGVPKSIPVLIDEKRAVSKKLKLFTEFWDGVQSEQNISAIFLVDKQGILQWKYIGQMTEDRPSMDHVLKVIDKMLR